MADRKNDREKSDREHHQNIMWMDKDSGGYKWQNIRIPFWIGTGHLTQAA